MGKQLWVVTEDLTKHFVPYMFRYELKIMFENCSTLHFIAHTQRDQLGEREVERGRVRKNYFCLSGFV